jgi:hypothetical protein
MVKQEKGGLLVTGQDRVYIWLCALTIVQPNETLLGDPNKDKQKLGRTPKLVLKK